MVSPVFPVSREQFIQLFALFGDLLSRALILIDKNCITLYTSFTQPNNRIFIITSGKDRYLVKPGINFCPCPAFRYQHIQSNADPTCKHVLACRLSGILQRTKSSSSSDEYITSLTLEWQSERDQSLLGPGGH